MLFEVSGTHRKVYYQQIGKDHPAERKSFPLNARVCGRCKAWRTDYRDEKAKLCLRCIQINREYKKKRLVTRLPSEPALECETCLQILTKEDAGLLEPMEKVSCVLCKEHGPPIVKVFPNEFGITKSYR